MSMDLFKSTTGLERLLDYQMQRHGLLASNVTNAETPDYRPRDLVFSDAMKVADKMASTNSQHYGATIATKDQHFVRVEYGPTSVDKNGVRIERAMARLTANKLRYNSSVEVLKRRLALIKYAASGRG